MKAYKIELLIFDFDEIGEEEIADALETTRYPNHCISPTIMDIQEREIGEWDDNLPINRIGRQKQEYKKLFGIK